MKVSVIVPTFNRSQYIGECLDSLLAQTLPAHEIIVVDDGSDDDTPEVLARYRERVRYVRKENGGKPSAVNLGLSMAQGDLIWIFDDDDAALPDAIELRQQVLARHPEAAFVYSPHFYGSNGPDGRIVRGPLHPLPDVSREQLLSALMEGCFFHLNTALVRTEAYRTLGGFDVGMLRSQDYDIQLRLALHFKSVASTAPSFIFRQHAGERGTKVSRHAASDRGKMFLRYSQKIGRKLRSDVPLGDYLVPRRAAALSFKEQRQALLARAVVMGAQGCIPELLQDLKSALDIPAQGKLLSRAEHEAIARSVRVGYADAALQEQGWGSRDGVRGLRACPGGRRAILALADGAWRLARGYPGGFALRMRRLRRALALVFTALG